MNLSVRNRVALWYAIAVPALIFAVAFTAQKITVGNLRKSLDESLEDRAATAAVLVNNDPSRRALNDLEEASPANVGLFIGVYDAKTGGFWYRGATPAPLRGQLLTQLQSTPESGQFATLKLRDAKGADADAEVLRSYVAPARDPDTGEIKLYIATAESLVSINRAQARLLWYTLTEGAIGSVLSLAIGLLIFQTSFRPLDRILAHLKAVSGKNLKTHVREDGLPPELRELAATLNDMWGRLDQSFAEREHLVATVSHELKTPLTALLGQTELALTSPALRGPERQALENMRGEIRRLVRLTSNLMRNVELEKHPRVQFEPVSIKDLAEEVVGDLWVLAGERTISVGTEGGLNARGNRDLLKELLINLVENAIKYTPPWGEVGIDWHQDGASAVITVRDNGVGIPGLLLPKLGEPFLKGTSSAGKPQSGSGLGLSIVRHIVEIHGGEVSFKSREGEGTEVTVRLPLEIAADGASAPSTPIDGHTPASAAGKQAAAEA